jgi:hypothetical protein
VNPPSQVPDSTAQKPVGFVVPETGVIGRQPNWDGCVEYSGFWYSGMDDGCTGRSAVFLTKL